MTTTTEGWGVLRPGDRKHHYYDSSFSLCRRVGFYHGELTPDDGKPGADDCAACRRELNKRSLPPKPERVNDQQADLLEWILTGHQPRFTDHVTVGRLDHRGLIEYKLEEPYSWGYWQLTVKGQRAWAHSRDKTSSASRQHHIDTGTYLMRGEVTEDA